MRKALLMVAALLLCLPVMSEAQEGAFIRYYPSVVSSSGGTLTGRLLLPAGTAAAPSYSFSSDPATGLYDCGGNCFGIAIGGVLRWYSNVGGTLFPNTTDISGLGGPTLLLTNLYLARATQGSKSKALTGGSATTFLRVAVAQTAAANYGGGGVGYTVYATDGTDSQSLVGRVYFAMVNKAGTETCAIGEVGTPVLAQSSGSTLTCTFTCATAAADTVDIAANCASGLVETTFTIEYRGDMQKPNTYTPQ